MPLETGTRLGQYEVVAPIGAGGMGEVYRAHDTKLGREVAIKVLPDELAQVQERLDRFEREAKLLAALNHANVATLYGLEHSGVQMFLVMELVEGETLAERIARGPIPFEEARDLFIQIAEGLEAAHEKGIIHRDLKPANIKVTPEGKIKILDFGLAKAFATEADAPAESSQSPTLTKGTALGAIMGTAGYMSPEQARGKLVDRRTDVWAFGCCLYEALTGRRAFEGETVPDTLSAVLGQEPDWSRLPASTPRSARRLLERALRKDMTLRLQHVGDARVELLDTTADVERPSAPSWTNAKVWLGAVALVLVGVLLGMLMPRATTESTPARPLRVTIDLPDAHTLVVPGGTEEDEGRYPPVAIARDGRHLVFAARDSAGTSRLYLRALDSLEPLRLEGTENAELPFFSPDGEWIGFLLGRQVSKVPVTGGVPTAIGNTPLGSVRGAAWISADTIVLGGMNSPLARMDAVTGTVEPLTELVEERRENYHAWPNALPDGEHLVFTVWDEERPELAVVSLSTREWHRLERTNGATQPHYLDSGHLVFFRDGALFAAPFDTSRLAIDGPARSVPMRDVVNGWNAGMSLGFFTASRSGSIVFVPGSVDLTRNRVVRVDRSGTAEPISELGRYRAMPAVSRDGTRLAVNAHPGLFVYDLERQSRARVTRGIEPVWSADGQTIYFSWFDRGDGDLLTASTDGSGTVTLLSKLPFDQFALDVSPDGKLLAYTESHPETDLDLRLLRLDDTNESVAFSATPARESGGAFSPDGRFIAYASDESGRDEVYVKALGGDGAKVLVSVRGGTWPRWAASGHELFYWEDETMMSVPVRLDPFEAGTPEVLFEGEYKRNFDVFPDGEHFAMITSNAIDLRELVLVVNWSTELAELVPVE